MCSRRLRSPDSILNQFIEILSLVQFGIRPFFQNIVSQITVSILVHLGISQNLLKESHCFRHIFLQAFQHDIRAVRSRENIEVACQTIKFFIDLFQAFL